MNLEIVIAVVLGAVAGAAFALAWRTRSTLSRRVDGHDRAIVELRRAVGLLTVPDNRPTGTHRPAFPKAEVTVVSPSPVSAEERARMAADLEASDRAQAGTGLSLAGVDESAPPAAPPPAAPPSLLVDALTRAKQEPDVRRTRQMERPGGAPPRKIPLREALAAVERAIEVPPEPVERILAAVRASGLADPAPYSGAAERIDARYRELCAAARAEGRAVDHCRGDQCGWIDANEHTDLLCMCNCDGCVAALVISRVAERDVMGPGVGPDSDPVPDSGPLAASASCAPPRSHGPVRAAELAAEVKRSRPSAPFVAPALGPAPPGSRPVPDAATRAALPSVANPEDEDSQDDPNTKLMTKPSAAEIAAGARVAPAPPAERAAGPKRPRAAPPHPPPRRVTPVMGMAPPPGAPPQSSHRPPVDPARSATLPSQVSPLLAGAKVGGDDELTIERKPEVSG
jgi:hypothetical protein